MKFSRIVPTLLLLLSLTIILPQRAGTTTGVVQRGAEERAKAQKAWQPFFEALRTAVSKRDRAALKEMMADFNGAETPEDVFKRWDNPRTRGWENLTRTLNLGTVQVKQEAREIDADEVPYRMGPPASQGRKYKGWLTVFKYYEDGKWHFVQFTKV